MCDDSIQSDLNPGFSGKLAVIRSNRRMQPLGTEVVLITIGFAICGMFSLNVADSKGHAQLPWFLAGFLFGPIGLIASCGLGDKRMSRTLRRIAEEQRVDNLPTLEFEDDENAS